MINLWRLCQFIVAGLIVPFLYDDDDPRKLISPPEVLLTFKGFVVTVALIVFLLTELFILWAWEKRKGWNSEVDIKTKSILERIFGADIKDKFGNWFDKIGITKHNPNFYEEYLYYKYYYKMAKWAHKKKYIIYIPDDLDYEEKKSKRNYYTAKLSGIK